ncbi:DENN domain-containing protein 2B-like [Brienomyrus brachyistius]|uniref:DENN domain-containing protein 2B-like n=1 Tax=Brienomyrus brachyistius TaxID=42636 RepID=UPI0020B43B93|nr:DENN domain-containing protein 2B-like [Brienomyrus brachyistius]XP_048887264.1 DENN domain-containing protein 2B-like [Brienomyrus brachyistius]
MTANKSAKTAPQDGGGKVPRNILGRCQSASPPPILPELKEPVQPRSDSTESSSPGSPLKAADGRASSLRAWAGKTIRLHSSSTLSTQEQHLKAKSACAPVGEGSGGQEQKDNKQEGGRGGAELSSGSVSRSSLSYRPPSAHVHHQRSLSLGRSVTGLHSAGIRSKTAVWEHQVVVLPRMSLCLEKRQLGEQEGPGEACPSTLSSSCSNKTFDFKSLRRMSTPFSGCSYAETKEDEAAAPEPGCLSYFEKRSSKAEASGVPLRSLTSRRESSAVLSRIQKIEQALKENPPRAPPQYPSSCYTSDRVRHRSFTIGGPENAETTRFSKRASVSSVTAEPDSAPGPDRLAQPKQEPSPDVARTGGTDMPSAKIQESMSVNPVPKPKRTFEYEANRSHSTMLSTNGLPPSSCAKTPPPLSSTPSPCSAQGIDGSHNRRALDRESCESEDTGSLLSSYPSSPTENGTTCPDTCSRSGFKSASEENAYEDIVESHKENPYEDVDLKGRAAGRKSRLLPERCWDPLSRTWTSQDSTFCAPPQLPSKPSSQSLHLPGPADRKCHRPSRLSKRHSHDDGLLLPRLSLSSSSCVLLDDGLSGTSDTLSSRRSRRVPKLVQRINSIYCSKRGKKRLKRFSLSSMEMSSLRDDNSESESDSDDRFKAHAQRLQKLQSLLRRAPSYRTLELQLIEWQERELFEYFVVVSLKKKPTKNSYCPEVTYQFPKLERPSKQIREAEQRLKAIPQFCFPDAKDWSPVSQYSSETFSFMLTGEDGSRRFGYCRRLLPSGKGPRLPEVYCVISRLGCFDLFSKILDEVERRRGISAALVYPFMRSLMESPFPAPGKTIKVKTFLPGSGNEVIELRRPLDSRLEHVNLEILFSCLSVRQVLGVFASLLLERRVIFIADKLSTLSSCVHAVAALLYPFSWQHTFIPVLPSSMVDIVCCPTPFLVGLLSSSLPKLKGLPVEEALMVDLGTDRFIRQMDDEAVLLPRKLQSALEQALEQRNDIINQDSDSESDEECNSLSSVVSEAFIRFFLETIGHYSLFLTQNERGDRVFQRDAFRKSVASKSVRRFLGVFMESQMFAGFIQDRELRKSRAKGLFEERVEQYLEELPDTEQSAVNKFLRGLGSKMKFLHKKS